MCKKNIFKIEHFEHIFYFVKFSISHRHALYNGNAYKGSIEEKKSLEQLPETPHILCNNNKFRKKVLTNVCKNFSTLFKQKETDKTKHLISFIVLKNIMYNDDKVSP